MKRFSLFAPTTTLVVLAIVTSQVRADYMNWGYSTAASPPGVTSGTGSIQLTGIATGTAAASIPVLGIQDSSNAAAGRPDVYNSPFSLAMKFTDNATSDAKTLTLSGLLKGNLTATTSSVVASFSGPNSLTLDGHVYTVTIPPLPLTASGTGQQSLMANITVANAPTTTPTITPHTITPHTIPSVSPGGVSSAPEPTSLVLGGLGWSLLGVGGWWKRSRRSRAGGS